MEYVVLDTETTGMSPAKGSKLIEIAGVVVRDWEIVETESFDELINPERIIPLFITQLTGINNLMVRGKRTFEIVLSDFYDFVSERVLVIQNAPFDLSFLDFYGERAGLGKLRNPFLDTISMSRALFSGRHNLDIILARLNIFPKNRHRAMGDVMATAEAFIRMSELIGNDKVEKFTKLRNFDK